MTARDGVSTHAEASVRSPEGSAPASSPVPRTTSVALGLAGSAERRRPSSLRQFIRRSPVGTISALFLLAAIGVALFGRTSERATRRP